MKHLSLFTGAGGGELGALLLGWRTIGYVEIDDYCQRVIKARIEDGILPKAPIFSDIRAFNSEGYAASYTGLVDVISAGWPCQDISCIGTRKGLSGERSGLWSEVAATIRIIRPRYALLENVPAITNRGIDEVLGELASMGFDAEWGMLGADAFNCEHHRKRFWMVAHPKGFTGLKTSSKTLSVRTERYAREMSRIGNRRHTTEPYWFLHESYFNGRIDAVANRLDRSKAIGNGQVPAVFRAAWNILNRFERVRG